MGKFYTPTKLSENIRKTPEGFLLCLDVPIARTGTMEYGDGETPIEADGDGKVIITREAEEVFRPVTIASAEGKSITIKHPTEFVNPANWKDLTKGSMQNVRRGKETDDDGEEMLLADLLITDELAIQMVLDGLREVSAGYEAEYEETGKGKGKQIGIVINHLALVDDGRAGPSYAINDHKGKVDEEMETLKELKNTILGLSKTIDAALSRQSKGKKTKDESATPKADKVDKSGEVEMTDAEAYDELVQMVKDLGEKVAGMGKGKDSDEEDKPKKKEEESEDDDSPSMIDDRLKTLEAAVAKLLKTKNGDEDEEETESEDEESEDEDEESAAMEDEESEDEEEEEKPKKKMGDTASRVEILSPGMSLKQKNVEGKALKAAFATVDGKKVILKLTGGKRPVFDSREKILPLFRAASEVLKVTRGNGLDGSKNGVGYETFDSTKEDMTPEKLNDINAAYWAKQSKQGE